MGRRKQSTTTSMKHRGADRKSEKDAKRRSVGGLFGTRGGSRDAVTASDRKHSGRKSEADERSTTRKAAPMDTRTKQLLPPKNKRSESKEHSRRELRKSEHVTSTPEKKSSRIRDTARRGVPRRFTSSTSKASSTRLQPRPSITSMRSAPGGWPLTLLSTSQASGTGSMDTVVIPTRTVTALPRGDDSAVLHKTQSRKQSSLFSHRRSSSYDDRSDRRGMDKAQDDGTSSTFSSSRSSKGDNRGSISSLQTHSRHRSFGSMGIMSAFTSASANRTDTGKVAGSSSVAG